MRRLAILGLFAILAAAAAAEDQAAVEARCAALAKRIEGLLGPKFKEPVPVEIVTREFIAGFARDLEARLTPAAVRGAAQRLAVRLRQIPEGYDLTAQQIELIQQEFVGLYDPEKDRFYVVDRAGDPGSRLFVLTAAHELVHAYRDIDHDYYRRMLDSVATDVDWTIAITCLAEGDAMLLGQVIGTAELMQRDAKDLLAPMAGGAGGLAAQLMTMADSKPALKEFPPALRELLLGRYAAGVAFAGTLAREGGAAALDAAYREPPRSTEQVLHPEKYAGPNVDEPTVFAGGDPTAALGDGWTLALSNVLGEFETRVHFTERFGRERAARIAAGWDGARFFFCTHETQAPFVGIVSVWDRELDAVEFADAWAEWASRRDGGEREIAIERSARSVETKEGRVYVLRRGLDVFVADGVPAGREQEVVAAMAAAKRTSRAADARPSR